MVLLLYADFGFAFVPFPLFVFTFTLQRSFFLETFAVMVALPVAFARTFPADVTVAMLFLLEDHFTFFAFAPFTFKLEVLPTVNVKLDLFNLIAAASDFAAGE